MKSNYKFTGLEVDAPIVNKFGCEVFYFSVMIDNKKYFGSFRYIVGLVYIQSMQRETSTKQSTSNMRVETEMYIQDNYKTTNL